MLRKKIIDKDLFNISRRIKGIDKNYYILFDNKTNKWEVHNLKQKGSTYCLTCPYNRLDSRLIDYVYYTSTQHNPDLIKIIEKNNKEIDDKIIASENDYIRSNLKDIYSYASNSSKSIDLNKSLNYKWF